MKILGLDTLGISLARVDYAPLGENPPHTHLHAIEIITVLEDTLYVGFVTSNLDNKFLFTKINRMICLFFHKDSSTSNSIQSLQPGGLQLLPLKPHPRAIF